MWKRWFTICLAAVMLLGCIGVVLPGVFAAEEETSIHSLLNALPLQNIGYAYENNGYDENSAVYFSSALLLQDARSFSGELTKASVALALAAYSSEYVNNLLSEMGFTAMDNSAAYSRTADNLTLDDNDYVAYTIANQLVTHPITGEKYLIYCVPIKGTGANAEWFSNFNIGNGKEHEGFRNASMRVYNALQSCFEAEEYNIDSDHRIVWLTGHSRGAACANLIAGWLSRSSESNTTAAHVFAYTFACPSVSQNADTSLTNIYNFNNPGDLIPLLPLKEWEYKRYGQTIMLDTSSIQLTNVKQQFERVTSETYAGEVSDQHYRTLLTNIFGTDLDAFNDSAYMKLTLGLAGWALGGNKDAKMEDVLIKYVDGIDFILETIKLYNYATDLETYLNILLGSNFDYDRLSNWTYQAYFDTKDMTTEEFQDFLYWNSEIISEIEEKTQIGISVPDSFLYAHDILKVSSLNLTSVIQSFEAAIALIADDEGNVAKKIGDAHTQSIYTIWINSLYYGYQGWYETDSLQHTVRNGDYLCIGSYCFAYSKSLQEVNIPDNVAFIGDCAFIGCKALTEMAIPENVTRIGTWAFASCSGMKELTLPDTPVALGKGAFGDCSGLRTVTLPVDYDFSQNPFCYNPRPNSYFDKPKYTSGVTTINYTVGRSGVIPDRTTDSEDPTYYQNTLEYVSRYNIQTITFEEGITHIGNYMFYDCFISNIEFPSTLKTIGDNAFSYCSCPNIMKIPASVISIGDHAFAHSGIDELTLPDTPVALGNGTFGNCSSLRTVTLPVDYDFSQNPFESTTGVTTINYTVGSSGFMPDRTTDSEDSAWYQNTLEYASRNNIQTITFGEGITHIGNNLFYDGSESLTNVQFPSSLETIGDYAFCNCTQLERVDFIGSAPAIQDNAFSNTVATCYYPGWDASWTEDVMQNYGGTLTWIPYRRYEITENGTDNVVEKGQDFSVHIDADDTAVAAVYLDGNLIDPSCYTVTAGSNTIITFISDYLATLEPGEYLLLVRFRDGLSIMTLTVDGNSAAWGKGDLNLDGDVDAHDLTLLARHVGGIELITGQGLLNADVDGDGVVDANDLTRHARYVGGIIKEWEQA